MARGILIKAAFISLDSRPRDIWFHEFRERR